MSVGVLFVCLGNRCRSPSAQVILEHEVQQLELQHITHQHSL